MVASRVQPRAAGSLPIGGGVETDAGHGWPDDHRDLGQICQWFDRYLARKP
jgi:hypothetical protein